MADRRRQTVLLLESRLDGLYLPPGALVTAAGLAPGAMRPCPDCARSPRRGWMVDRFGRQSPCRRCGGAAEPSGKLGQWVKRDGGSGLVAFDPMDTLEVDVGSSATSSTPARPRATVRCDACDGDGAHGNGRRCEVCGGTGRRDLHAFELQLDTRDQEERDPLGSAIDRRADAGSYRELDRALDELRQRDRRAHAALLEAIDVRVRPLPAEADEALSFVVARMPSAIKVPAAIVANARELEEWRKRAKGRGTSERALRERDAEIRRLVRRGVPVQRVAFEFELSVAHVYRVVRSEREVDVIR